MNLRIRLAFLIVAISCSALLSAATQPAQQTRMDSFALDRVRGMLRDAHDCVKKNYYDPKFHNVDMDARFHEYDDKTKVAPTLNHGLAIVAAYLDALKDSHTFFEPPPRPYRFDYGFRMQVIGDRTFVTRVRPDTDAVPKVHPGDEVLSYNGFSVNRDDFQALSYYFGALAPSQGTQLELRDPGGVERRELVEVKMKQLKKTMDLTDLSGPDFWDIIRRSETEDHVMRQQWLELGDVTIWKMPEFDMSEDEVDHAFGIVRKHKALVLDLRSNPGGAVDTLKWMLGNIFDHDVKIADRVGRKPAKPDIAKARANAFSGKLIVLLDSNSASAAELFARVVQLEHRGLVVGDRSAGAVMEATHFQFSQGIDTKIFYGFSVTAWDLIMSDGKSLEHVGVTPDETVLPAAGDIAAGRDPALARAVELAGGNLQPAEAGKLFPFEWLPF